MEKCREGGAPGCPHGASPANHRPERTMKSILVVDDNPPFLRALERMLSASGEWMVSTARNGSDAVRLAAHRTFDLVVTDIFMPDKDGYELIGALRKLTPATKIIAMTGGGERMDVGFLKVARKLGASETLAKPFSEEELLRSIRRLLGPAGATPV